MYNKTSNNKKIKRMLKFCLKHFLDLRENN